MATTKDGSAKRATEKPAAPSKSKTVEAPKKPGAETTAVNGTITAPVNLESISIATYICDFGNVVVGSTKKKSFRLTNVGKLPVTFNFDKKLLT
jgi:hypothetical protein